MPMFGKRLVTLAALAAVLSVGGSHARADLTLNIAAASGPTIAINSTTGSATLSGQPVGTYIYAIDGQAVTFVVAVANAAVTQSFTGNNLTATFEADGLIVGGQTLASTFDGYRVTQIQATEFQNPNNLAASLADVQQSITGGTAGSTLTTTAGYNAFTAPVGTVGVRSTLGVAQLDSGTVTFFSTVSGTNVPSGTPLTLTAAQVASGTLSAVANGFANNGSPYVVSNQIVLSGVAGNSVTNMSASTQINAVPEPATLAMAFSTLPLLVFAAWRRRKSS